MSDLVHLIEATLAISLLVMLDLLVCWFLYGCMVIYLAARGHLGWAATAGLAAFLPAVLYLTTWSPVLLLFVGK